MSVKQTFIKHLFDNIADGELPNAFVKEVPISFDGSPCQYDFKTKTTIELSVEEYNKLLQQIFFSAKGLI